MELSKKERCGIVNKYELPSIRGGATWKIAKYIERTCLLSFPLFRLLVFHTA